MNYDYPLQKDELDERINNVLAMGGDMYVMFGYLNKALDTFYQRQFWPLDDYYKTK